MSKELRDQLKLKILEILRDKRGMMTLGIQAQLAVQGEALSPGQIESLLGELETSGKVQSSRRGQRKPATYKLAE